MGQRGKKINRMACPICKAEIAENKYEEHYQLCRANELLKLHGLYDKVEIQELTCKFCKIYFPHFSKMAFHFHQRSCRENPNRVALAKVGSSRSSKYRPINRSKAAIAFYKQYAEKLRHYDNYYMQIKSADTTETIEMFFDEDM